MFSMDACFTTKHYRPKSNVPIQNSASEWPRFGVAMLPGGYVGFAFTNQNIPATFLFQMFSVFAQDTWQPKPRLTLTYGLRWGVEVPPKTIEGPAFPALANYDLNNLSQITLAPAGTSPYQVSYRNFMPRLGVAYQLAQKNGAASTVFRGGIGLYDDLAAGAAGNLVAYAYPYTGYAFYDGSQISASSRVTDALLT
jgi:outer membrane receptor protein involved in Fe transport